MSRVNQLNFPERGVTGDLVIRVGRSSKGRRRTYHSRIHPAREPSRERTNRTENFGKSKQREGKKDFDSGDMTVPQLALFCLFCCGCWRSTGKIFFFGGGGVITVVFHFFLFHYSKARTSADPEENMSDSVHPLMRLSPKLSQRRKKTVVLLVRQNVHLALDVIDSNCLCVFLVLQNI
uniref:Transmembrane protein n=1 Tax=Hippocampus comes TaxID=109280 RepID=A0A3Q2Z3I8_HIPCM